MKSKNVDTRLWLDREIADLVGFSYEQAGKKGLKYARKEVKRLVKGLLKEEIKDKFSE
jgi:hypothetical protein